MNKRTRKKILRAGYKHPRFSEAFQEEYRVSAEEAGKQIAKALTLFCEAMRNASKEIAKFVAAHNNCFNSTRGSSRVKQMFDGFFSGINTGAFIPTRTKPPERIVP